MKFFKSKKYLIIISIPLFLFSAFSNAGCVRTSPHYENDNERNIHYQCEYESEARSAAQSHPSSGQNSSTYEWVGWSSTYPNRVYSFTNSGDKPNPVDPVYNDCRVDGGWQQTSTEAGSAGTKNCSCPSTHPDLKTISKGKFVFYYQCFNKAGESPQTDTVGNTESVVENTEVDHPPVLADSCTSNTLDLGDVGSQSICGSLPTADSNGITFGVTGTETTVTTSTTTTQQPTPKCPTNYTYNSQKGHCVHNNIIGDTTTITNPNEQGTTTTTSTSQSSSSIDTTGLQNQLEGIKDAVTVESGSLVEQGSFNVDADELIASAEQDFSILVSTVKTEFSNLINVNLTGGGSFVDHQTSIKGKSVSVSWAKYSSALSIIGSIVLFMASLYSLIIIIR